MIRYTCSQCRTRLESPLSLVGELDKCPVCGHMCPVPVPRKTNRRALLAVAGIAGVLIAAIVVAVLLYGVSSGTSPSASEPSSGQTFAAKPPDHRTVVGRQDAVEAHTRPGQSRSQPSSAPSKGAPKDIPLSPEQLFERASPAVVYVVVRDKNFKPIGLGSGFFVDAGGLIVTNYHVIKGATFATARLSSGATLFVDGVAATDPHSDLALLMGIAHFQSSSSRVTASSAGSLVAPLR